MTMATKAACVLAVWVLVASGLSDLGSARAPLGSKPQREFDYFALSLQWPGTICASTRHCCATNGCCRSEPLQTFTIHGLWPDYDDGTWPSCCRRTQFEMDKILPLKEVLDKYWPSLYCSKSGTCFSGKGLFWAHEVQETWNLLCPCGSG
ncbi:Ribonuclease 2 [Zea mays]|uniref:Ribonuclease 2 n=1 Tax=Zea mays TaxID=4577 RepID=A0A1D6N4Q5_MAIZE|nr:Ribonuclease 2 [Zea mays]ONM35616.1 Ribonuclease 2 [Zea mays]ONM35619.1 Ribonuclease 2 [Zea mays]